MASISWRSLPDRPGATLCDPDLARAAPRRTRRRNPRPGRASAQRRATRRARRRKRRAARIARCPARPRIPPPKAPNPPVAAPGPARIAPCPAGRGQSPGSRARGRGGARPAPATANSANHDRTSSPRRRGRRIHSTRSARRGCYSRKPAVRPAGGSPDIPNVRPPVSSWGLCAVGRGKIRAE